MRAEYEHDGKIVLVKKNVRRQHRKAINTIRLHVVCRDCNTVWMSQLETAVEPILRPLIDCEKIVLGPMEAKILGRWIAKTVIIAEAENEAMMAIPEGDRKIVMDGGPLPQRWKIWLGVAAIDTGLGIAFQTAEITLGPSENFQITKPNTNFTLIKIGRLIVVSLTSTFKFELDRRSKPFRKLFPLVPIPYRLDWPPKESLSDQEIVLILRALSKTAGTPDPLRGVTAPTH